MAHFRSLGEEPNPSWSSIEIKDRIRELSERDHQRKGLGVNGNSLKEQIYQECVKQGLSVTRHDTKGSLLMKLRAAQEYEVAGSDETIVGFGKYASLKYKEVPEYYIKWAIDTYQEGATTCCGRLARLAKWAMVQRGMTAARREERPVQQATASSVASSAGAQMRARKATKRAGASPAEETAPEPELASQGLEKKMESMLGQVMAGMQVLSSRLGNLEAKQQSSTNTDDNKSLEPTPSQDSFKMVYPNPECQSESTQGCAWPMQDKKPGPVECREHA